MGDLMTIQDRALKIRQQILKMSMGANGGHIAPSYSMTDIVAELFFDDILTYDPKKPEWEDRDYFILSKGHGVLALYAALSMAGFFPEEKLYTFGRVGSELGSLARAHSVPGVEASTGSLGHGLSYAAGIALALKKDNKKNRVYALLGDGECEEGSVWEAVMFASHNRLDNLTIIVDYNGLQAMDSLQNIMSLGDFSGKFRSFGLDAADIDGHNFDEIKEALLRAKGNAQSGSGKPMAIVAHTVKGKGISFMENVPIWHYRIPNEQELEIALKELKMTKEDLGDYEKLSYRNVI
ncbi:transketolase [Butyrivibrio sp. VCD2006]|uniref:transketolase n=1 Tax=Butyrivibrio sp. VCD2006 TaxID=1280664 RepID=UPI0004024621|nr:transketolase [Butyrivibrio sp. VCD2006]